MSKLLIVLLASFTASAAFAVEGSSAPHTRVTYPGAVSIEVLGRGIMYSVNFDQVLNDDMAAGFGYGSVATELNSVDGESAKMIPAYFNYYFSRAAGSLYGTVGVNVILNAKKVKGFDATTSDLTFPKDSVMPTFGLGYENRGDNGFLFRAAAYGVVGKDVTPWLGFSFGYAF